MAKAKLTKSFLEQSPPGKYWDTELRSFGAVVRDSGYISFVVQKSGRKHFTIGSFPKMTVAQARALAKKRILAVETNGELFGDSETITLRQAMEMHANDMQRDGKSTHAVVIADTEKYLKAWIDNPLRSISRIDCYNRHTALTNKHGSYLANKVFRQFRAIYNTAIKRYEHLPTNPCIGVKWNKEKPRCERIKNLHDWHADVCNVGSPVRRDYHLFLLMTGLRRTDAFTVRWEEIDFDNGTIFRPKPKGGKDKAFTVPLSTQTIALLKRRKIENVHLFGSDKGWVFPIIANSSKGKKRAMVKHLSEPRDKLVSLPTPHIVRHTYASIADDLEIPQLSKKIFMNHTVSKGDVTDNYTHPSLDALRRRQQKISDYIWEQIGLSGMEVAA